MHKLFAEDMEMWAVVGPAVGVVPLMLLLGAPAGLLATAGLWLLLRSVAVIFETTPESRFDPLEAAARSFARLAAVPPEGRPSGLADALLVAADDRDGDIEDGYDDEPVTLPYAS
jgi:hypothetical protein